MSPTIIILSCICGALILGCFSYHVLYTHDHEALESAKKELKDVLRDYGAYLTAVARFEVSPAEIVYEFVGSTHWYSVCVYYRDIKMSVRTFTFPANDADARQWALLQAEELCDKLNETLTN